MLVTYRPRAWHLAVVALIALFDLAALYMVLQPRVAADYRAYYIDRTSSCFPRVVSGHYPLGEPVSFVPDRSGYDRDSIRWCGFMPPSTTGIRSFGDYGVLKLVFTPPDEDLLMTFSSWVNFLKDKPERDVQVIVNGERIATLNYPSPSRVDGKIIVPERLVKAGNGTMEVKFVVPRVGPPGTNGEPVTLQLRLESFRLVPLSKAPPGQLGTKEAGSPPPPRSRQAQHATS